MARLEENELVLLNAIPALVEGSRFIVGVDGLSRSGKTTVVKKLSQLLQERNVHVCVFHMDDYIVSRNKRYNTGHEEWHEYYNLQWDVDWLSHHLFNKLREFGSLNLPFYDPETDSHNMQNIVMPDTCVVIIEGVFLQRKEWRGFYDYVAYLDCPQNMRFARESISARQNLEKFRNRYWKAEDYYVRTEAPAKQADAVLNN
ncbi:Uridine kinase [Paenibacillus plantiphilus]|uniref:Uridine kinase n=1 Tax=Paenibacillus plantiphilus TaxID=2905650 RepID=A0ABM9C5Y4_9BACL|nr:Uridine kinase [Paenibacillus plantiphilus]